MLAKDYQRGYSAERKQEVEERRRRQNRPRKNGSPNKMGTLISILILLGICLLLLSRYTAITSIRTDITKLEKNIEELEKKKVNLQASLEGIKSSEKIEEEASLKLGMDYPQEGQVVYLSVKDTDKIDKDLNYIIKDRFSKIISGVQVFFRR